MSPILRLYEDVFSSDPAEVSLLAAPRLIFVVHGSMTIDGQVHQDGEAWHGESEPWLVPGEGGATCWRFELTTADMGDGAIMDVSRPKLSAALGALPKGELLLRGDSVAFPPGGCAFLHRHQGPGIRILVEGGIRIDTLGRSTSYGPGGAWFESGPEPVFAQAAPDRNSRFVRMMILPRALLGKSSLEYLNEEDKAKPKLQSYKVFADQPIAFRAG
jgi:hypothetical protein